ncbi:MAG TPA: ribosome small subunit-dependent GTPase A [Aliidongia sp.]|nr:ribosome small subunit-dependent GTPase A [Aliidongia sp.]
MSLDLLTAYGWDSAWADNFSAIAAPGWVPARILQQQRDRWTCVTAAGELQARSTLPDPPGTGDWVALEPVADTHLVRALLPRRNRLSRQAAGLATEEQVLAANMDTLFLCMALGRDFNLRRLERILTVAWSSGAAPVIVLTKADLAEPAEAEACRTAVEAAAPAVPVAQISSLAGTGLAGLEPWLTPGRTVAFIGASGAGKSTLVNALAGQELVLTGGLDGDGKGRHTTTWRSLVQLPDGALVIDNPGIRALQLWDGEDGLDRTFAEIRTLAQSCRFRDCRHEGEPGCAVRAAIEAGDLDPARLENRRKLAREFAFAERKQDKALQAAERRHLQRRGREIRARLKER